LKMFDLARRVFRAHEAAMKAAHLVTFGRRVLVLKLGLVSDVSMRRVCFQMVSMCILQRRALCLGWRVGPW
jgi:hypothetical protein